MTHLDEGIHPRRDLVELAYRAVRKEFCRKTAQSANYLPPAKESKEVILKQGELKPTLGDWLLTLPEGPTPGSYVLMMGVRQAAESWIVRKATASLFPFITGDKY